MFVSCAGLAFFLDIACFGEADLGEEGTDDFINENGKECDIAYDIAFNAKLFGFDSHTERNACLGEEGDTEIFYDVGITFCGSCADARTEVFTEGTSCDISDTDNNNGNAGEYGEIEFRAADNEEEDEDRSGPSVCSFHKFFGEVTDVAEYGTEHHTSEKRGEADMDAANVELEARDCNGHENERNGNCHTFGSGVEELLAECEEKTHDEAERERKYNLENGFKNDGEHVYGTGVDGFCDTEGDREYNETDSVVKRNDGEEDVGQRTLCLILTNDHECCCGSGCGCNGTENDRCGKGKMLRHSEMESDENDVYDKACEDCLEDTDDGSLFTDLLELSETEFVTDRECDEAERYVGNDAEACKLIVGDTDTGDIKCAEEKRSDQDTCDEVSCNCGELDLFRKSGEKKTCKKSNGKCQKDACCLRH